MYGHACDDVCGVRACVRSCVRFTAVMCALLCQKSHTPYTHTAHAVRAHGARRTVHVGWLCKWHFVIHFGCQNAIYATTVRTHRARCAHTRRAHTARTVRAHCTYVRAHRTHCTHTLYAHTVHTVRTHSSTHTPYIPHCMSHTHIVAAQVVRATVTHHIVQPSKVSPIHTLWI